MVRYLYEKIFLIILIGIFIIPFISKTTEVNAYIPICNPNPAKVGRIHSEFETKKNKFFFE